MGAARLLLVTISIVILILVAGCPFDPAPRSCVPADCTDGDPCTADQCDADNTCIHTPVVGCCTEDSDCDPGHTCQTNACVATEPACDSNDDCSAGQVCDVASGSCIDIEPCLSDGDCDIGDACFIASCDTATGLCHADPVVCDDGQTCAGGVCKPTCTADADCAAPDACTTAACLDGVCRTASSCDDTLNCTDDSCDAATGLCANVTNCPESEICSTDSGVCTPAAPCASDADCPDDGLFCTGAESCNLESGLCISSGNPCAADDPCDSLSCYEDVDECRSCPPGYTCDYDIDFTLGVDSITGTVCDDTIRALVFFNAPSGTAIPTLQSADSADGDDGQDVLEAWFNFTTATTVEPTLLNIETFRITDSGTALTTLSAAKITGVTLINSFFSTNSNPVVVSNLSTLVDVGLINTDSGLTIDYLAAATAGLADEMSLTLSQATDADITISSATDNGIEVLHLQSEGTSPNSLWRIAQTNGTSLSRLTVGGTQSLALVAPASVTTIAADSFGADLVAESLSSDAISITGGLGNDTLMGTAGADTMSGGAGNDTFQGLGGADTITTGGGDDIVSMVVADIGDTVTDFDVTADVFDWNTTLASPDGSVTGPAAATAFQSGAPGTAIAPTTTVFELTGVSVAAQTAANVVTALGVTATNADTNANIFFVIYTTGGGAAIWNWVNTDADVEAGELTRVVTLNGVAADTLTALNFQ